MKILNKKKIYKSYNSHLLFGLILTLFLSLNSCKDSKDDKTSFIESPAVGDVYFMETKEEGYFTTSQVTKVENESVYVIKNNLTIGKKDKLDQINKPDNYGGDTVNHTKSSIQELYKTKVIFDVIRD